MKFDTNSYFVSDTHWGHKNIIKFSNRPFSSVEEMDEALIENWNNTVPKDANVFQLGDFAFCDAKRVREILSRLNGNIYCIRGNHDGVLDQAHKKLITDGIIQWYREREEIKIEDQHITLCHYAHRVWNKSHYGSWMLYGHTHGKLDPLGRSADVGVDSAHITGKPEYRPLSYQEIKNFMLARDPHEKYS